MRLRKPIPLLIAVVVALRLVGAVEIDPKLYLKDIRFLASEKLKGRATGKPELDQAAQYIAQQFRALGLQALAGDSYYQSFPVTAGASPGKANRFTYTEGSRKASLKFGQDFRPLGFSASGKVSGQVVFAGYGITAHEYGYDDYAAISAKDKLVLVLRHEPQEYDENSVFGGRIYTNHSQLQSKALNAKAHGALAVIFINDTPTHSDGADQLENFSSAAGPANPGIPFVQVRTEVAGQWLRLAGHSLEEIVSGIDSDLRPRSFALPASLRVDLSVDVRQKQRTVHNVSGYLEGQTDEYVILGAHYDHIGLGEQFSLDPAKRGTIHPGADDNASGTAGVIELARWFAQHPQHRRGILFLTFAGEELGLLGSNFYANHPSLPLEKAVTMINMDMIGRVRQDNVYIGGLGTGSTFKALVDGLNADARFSLDDADADGYGSSDQFSFIPKEVPVLFFFSGLHPDYHRPSDTWDKITAPSSARLLEFIGQIIERLLDAPARPQFVNATP